MEFSPRRAIQRAGYVISAGYSVAGATKRALEHARKALAQVPDALNPAGMEALIQSLTKQAP